MKTCFLMVITFPIDCKNYWEINQKSISENYRTIFLVWLRVIFYYFVLSFFFFFFFKKFKCSQLERTLTQESTSPKTFATLSECLAIFPHVPHSSIKVKFLHYRNFFFSKPKHYVRKWVPKRVFS